MAETPPPTLRGLQSPGSDSPPLILRQNSPLPPRRTAPANSPSIVIYTLTRPVRPSPPFEIYIDTPLRDSSDRRRYAERKRFINSPIRAPNFNLDPRPVKKKKKMSPPRKFFFYR